jgi:hypothetical protein
VLPRDRDDPRCGRNCGEAYPFGSRAIWGQPAVLRSPTATAPAVPRETMSRAWDTLWFISLATRRLQTEWTSADRKFTVELGLSRSGRPGAGVCLTSLRFHVKPEEPSLEARSVRSPHTYMQGPRRLCSCATFRDHRRASMCGSHAA